MPDYDFSGYATKNDLRCADGLTIRRDAFKDNDGAVVPLVWQHRHDDPMNVLGHAILENREDGVYAYCSLNDTEPGNHAKTLIKHGDVNSMSIYANRLVKKGNDVVHGVIREVSLVLAGANPGALIDNLCVTHADGSEVIIDDEADMYFDSPLNTRGGNFELKHEDDEDDEEEIEDEEELDEEEDENDDEEVSHADDSEETVQDVFDTLNEKQKQIVNFLITQAVDGDSVEQSAILHADDENQNGSEETVRDVWDTLNEKQKNVVYYLISQAVDQADEDGETEDEEIEQSDFDEGEETIMKHNIFDGSVEANENVLSHDDMKAIFDDAKRIGSLKEACLQHGITEIETLFPEAHALNNAPELIARHPSEWVAQTWNAVRKSPFSRLKSLFADVTADEARARGYIKGKKKIEEVLTLLRRVTQPQTIYKLQKLDRDDIIDITDFDVVAWLKAEMRMMLDEELSRAILVGDGRLGSDESKIKEDYIRPIFGDNNLYTIYQEVEMPSDPNDTANVIIDAGLKARKMYMGSGNPWMFASTDIINDMLLSKDKIGRRLYNTLDELANALRVSKIVEVPLFEGVKRNIPATTWGEDQSKALDIELKALIVNPADYTIGADRGGAVTMFDDFDIDYNKYSYLIETRCSGSLMKPYSAIALYEDVTIGG